MSAPGCVAKARRNNDAMITVPRTGIAYDDSPHEDPNFENHQSLDCPDILPFDFRTHVRLS
jgi:hypothetical protein